MGVDTSVSAGYGFAIPEDKWKAFLATEPEGFDDGDYEVMENLLQGTVGLSFDFGGSYYDNRYNAPWVSIRRLTYTAEDIDGGGVVVFNGGSATADEIAALVKLAQKFDIDESQFGSVLSVLWN